LITQFFELRLQIMFRHFASLSWVYGRRVMNVDS